MNRGNKLLLRGAALLVIMAATIPVCAQTADNEWNFTIAPYLIIPGMSGTMGLRGVEADINASASDIFSNLKMGFNGYFAVQKGNWGFGTDIIYMALGGSNDYVEVDPSQGAFAFMGSRRLTPRLDLTFGVRWNVIRGRMEFNETLGPILEGTVFEQTKQWVDPVVGIHWMQPLGKRWEFGLAANVGGFGLASKIAVDVFPTIQFQAWSWGWIGGGWRLLYVNYETGYDEGEPVPGSDAFRYDVTTTGPVIGMSFRF